MRNDKIITFIDLFSGIGGFRIALESLGLKCVFSSEWDKYAQKTYFENFGEIPKGDITKIREEDIPSCDLLVGGFPCQAFSISGKQKGFKDTRGTLFFDIERITRYNKPKVLLLENVKNFEMHDKGRTLKTVKERLNNLGYNVYYKVLNASKFGVPTARKRIFIVGIRKDIDTGKFMFPDGTNRDVFLKDVLENDVDEKYEIKRDDIKIYKPESSTSIKEPVQIGEINNGGQGERIYSINGHAITLSAYGGGAAAKTGAYLINGKVRKLTPRECARVMGFPDTFKISVSDSQAYKQFGNSVAIPVVKRVAEEILRTIN